MFRYASHTISCLIALVAVAGPTRLLFADLLPPGRKRVSHELVFVDSQLLRAHRLIAAPVRGFGGVEEIQPERPFHFSSKYGTRLYVVPSDFVVPDRVGPGESVPFPSCDVPVPSITSVPTFSPVAKLLSTCKLIDVSEDQIRVELIDHVELDARGRPANMLRSMLPLGGIAMVGLIGCLLLWRRTHSLQDDTSEQHSMGP
jgi:hypothetical protein